MTSKMTQHPVSAVFRLMNLPTFASTRGAINEFASVASPCSISSSVSAASNALRISTRTTAPDKPAGYQATRCVPSSPVRRTSRLQPPNNHRHCAQATGRRRSWGIRRSGNAISSICLGPRHQMIASGTGNKCAQIDKPVAIQAVTLWSSDDKQRLPS
jgi:hypothetical protein